MDVDSTTASSGSDEPLKPQVVDEAAPDEAGTYITEPSKLIRIASMTRAMLDEVRQAPLDEGGRHRLLQVHESSLEQLHDSLSEDLQDELKAVFRPLAEETASPSELRIAQAQLVGWLEGLFHGIQASLFSQQASAMAQLDEVRSRKALEAAADQDAPSTGLYL